MSIADDGREPDATRDQGRTGEASGRPTNDPDQVTRRGAAGRRLVVAVAGAVLLVVLVVWLIIYLTARETSDESMSTVGAGTAQPTLSVVQ